MLRVYSVYTKEKDSRKPRRWKRCGLHIEANDIFHTIACMRVRLGWNTREHYHIVHRRLAIIETRWDMGWDGSAQERASIQPVLDSLIPAEDILCSSLPD